MFAIFTNGDIWTPYTFEVEHDSTAISTPFTQPLPPLNKSPNFKPLTSELYVAFGIPGEKTNWANCPVFNC